jgi:hypothetical protein
MINQHSFGILVKLISIVFEHLKEMASWLTHFAYLTREFIYCGRNFSQFQVDTNRFFFRKLESEASGESIKNLHANNLSLPFEGFYRTFSI